MIFTKKNSFILVVMLSQLLLGCNGANNSNSVTSHKLLTDSDPVNEAQVELLALKLMQADYTWMGLNNKTTVKKVLEYKSQNALNENFVQCVYESIDRVTYKKDSNEVALYLAKNYSHDVDDFIYRLNSLKPIVNKIFNHPEPVTFDTSNMLNSSALKILSRHEAVLLNETMKNRKYRPLLASIGLPAMNDNNVIQDLSVMQIGSMIEVILEAKNKCD